MCTCNVKCERFKLKVNIIHITGSYKYNTFVTQTWYIVYCSLKYSWFVKFI